MEGLSRQGWRRRTATVAGVLLVTCLLMPASAQPAPEPRLLHFTDQRDEDVRLFGSLIAQAPGAHALAIGAPLSEPVDLPLVEEALVWRQDSGEREDMRFADNASVRLVFRNGGLGALTVTLETHGPQGSTHPLATERAAADNAVLFVHLGTRDRLVPQGHTIALRITADEMPTLAALAFGTEDADSYLRVRLVPVHFSPGPAGTTDLAEPLADSDGDGYPDGMEARAGTDHTDPLSRPADQDVDGLPDADEARSGTNAASHDSDHDGVVDCLEDADKDGLTHCEEAALGTDPVVADSDGDGFSDGLEHRNGNDPILQSDFPSTVDETLARDLLTLTLLALGLAVLSATGLAIARRKRPVASAPLTAFPEPIAPARLIPSDHGERPT